MSKLTRRLALGATALAAMLAVTPALAQAKKEVLGVSMPAATHSFMAGAVYWANEAKKDLEKANPGAGAYEVRQVNYFLPAGAEA